MHGRHRIDLRLRAITGQKQRAEIYQLGLVTVRSAVKTMNSIFVPSIENLPKSAKFRIVTFTNANLKLDGSRTVTTSLPTSNGHPAPPPLLLDAKNANVLTHIMHVNGWLKDIKYSAKAKSAAKTIPGCLDTDLVMSGSGAEEETIAT